MGKKKLFFGFRVHLDWAKFLFNSPWSIKEIGGRIECRGPWPIISIHVYSTHEIENELLAHFKMRQLSLQIVQTNLVNFPTLFFHYYLG